MKFIFIYFFFISLSLTLYCEDKSTVIKNSADENNYVLKIVPIDKVKVVKLGKEYYSIYRFYENKINSEVTNYTIPEGLREYISFKLIIKKNPVIKYTYKYKFDGINIDYKFLRLDKAFEFFSYLIY